MSSAPAQTRTPGDWAAFQARVVEVIRLNRPSYAEASRDLFEVARIAGGFGVSDEDAKLSTLETIQRLFPGGPESELADGAGALGAPSAPGTWRSLPTLVEVLGSMPPPGERFSTGIPSLDRCSRGGFAPGRVYTFVGPPSRGKTVLVAQLALRWARERGALVIGFFCDEGSWQAALMMAEGIGFDRDDVEDRFAERRSELEEATRDLALRFPPPDAPETLLDAVEAWLRPEDAGRQLVVVVDSVQTVRCTKGLEAKGPKERADALMETAQLVSRRTNGILLLAAKANRASWSNKNPIDNVDPLAAGLDSSAIEYGSDAFFFLEGDPEKGVSLVVAKNRPGDGTKPRIPLGFDRARAQFAEIDSIAAQDEAKNAAEAKHAQAVEKAHGRILDILRRHPGISGAELQRLLGGRKQVNDDARTGLDVQGAIVAEKGARGALLWRVKS